MSIRSLPGARHLRLAYVSLLLLLAATLLPAPASAEVVISQVYGGGGNSNATFNRKFVEVFNNGAAVESLDGLTLQYASATGTGDFAVHATLTGNLAAGQYYLIGLGGGGTGDPLPVTVDLSASASPAQASGKYILADSATFLDCNGGSAPCSPAQLAQIVDLIGYGSANFFEGAAAAPTLSSSLAAFRDLGGCTDTNENGDDFTSAVPLPRNTASPTNVCAAPPADPVVSFGAAPSSSEGNPPNPNTLTFLVNVAPLPALGDTVTFDVTVTGTAGRFSYGGPASIVVEDDSVSPIEIEVDTIPNTDEDGDATVTVTLSNFIGADASQVDPLALEGTILDDDLDFEPISVIQGNGPLSPFDGDEVTTRGVVTGIRSNAFYIQTPQGEDDGDPLTSEGIYVYVGNPANMPPGLALGDLLFVQGTVDEFVPPADPNQLAITELVAPLTFTPVDVGVALPAPIVLTSPDPDGDVNQLEHLEFMRVTVPSFTVTAPTEPSGPDLFFGVVTGTPRPFREEGVDTLDCGINLPPEANVATVPCWDGNPELLRVKTNLLDGGGAFPLRTGAELVNLTGVLDYAFRRYSILTRTAEAPTVITTGEANGSPSAMPLPTEATIATFNVENLAVSGSSTYIRKADKVAQTVAEYMHYPDIIGFIEVANPETLDDIADRVSAIANDVGNPAPDPEYVGYMESTSGSQRLGFLVKTAEVAVGVPRVDVLSIEDRGGDLNVLCPDGVSFTDGLLNDRAPLFMDVEINAANGASYPVMVINNHLKSLIDIDSNDPADAAYACFNDPDPIGGEGRRNRAKRQQNAEYLTIQVDALQTASPDKPIVLVGDFNAFQFNDGYADLMNTILGTPPANDATVVPDDGVDLVNPDLVNLTELVTDDERYSYVFDGNAQVLDHVLANQAVIDTTVAFRRETPRVNADFTGADASNDTNPFRNSDHDPAVGYFNVSSFFTADLTVDGSVAPLADVGDTLTYTYEVENVGPNAAINPSITLTLQAGTGFVQGTFAPGWTCDVPAVGASGAVDCVAATLASAGLAEFEVEVEVLPAAADSVLAAPTVAVADSTDPVSPNQVVLETTVAELAVAPVFSPDDYTFDVVNNADIGEFVGQVLATDANAGDTLAYAILSGNTDDTFSIDANGNITVADSTLLAQGASFSLVVEVDDGTGLTDTATVQVNVPDINEAPVFDAASYDFDVNEGAAPGTAVGTVSATDPDAGDTLAYSIASGNTGGAFAIDATTGAITVAISAALTPGAEFTLDVLVTDADGLTDNTSVTVLVIDLPDAIFADGFED